MSPAPRILHADVDAFYASVAQRDDAALRGRPVLVGGGVVMAASYEARAHGVRGGMPTGRARALCPDAVVADPSWPAYKEASRAVFAIFARTGAVVEPGSMEEAFLDLADLADPAPEVAARLRREVRDEVGLPLSVGIARTKVLAKIASRSAKPDGVFVVAPEHELEFLHALPVERVWGVGAATAGRLQARGVRTVGEAARLTEPDLVAILGKAAGRYVHAVAHNREHRRVQRPRGRRSFGAQRALGRARRPRSELEATVRELAARIAQRMARRRRRGRTVVLRLRFADYEVAARSTTLAHATGDAGPIAAAGGALLEATMPVIERRGLTLIGLTVTGLLDEVADAQLALDLDDAPPPPSAPPGAADATSQSRSASASSGMAAERIGDGVSGSS